MSRLELDGPPRGGGCYCQRRPQLFVCDDTSWLAGVKKVCRRRLIRLARDPIYQFGSFEEPEIGAIKSTEKIRVIDLFSPVTRERRSGARCQRDGNRRRYYPRSDLSSFRGRGCEAATVSRPRDPADGEREAFSHVRGSWNDDHLVRRESCTHTPYLARHCRQKLVGSLPWGIPMVVVYR